MSEDSGTLTKKQKKALEFRRKKLGNSEVSGEKTVKKSDGKRKRQELELELEQEQELDQKLKLKAKTKLGVQLDLQLGEKHVQEEQPTKKRKTRRGKKGKGVNNGKGPRFILFVGNLPYDVTQAELVAHFKNANPDRIRIRQDKGIAFLEFDNDNDEIQRKMELALRMHHTMMRNRRINVELTVGGGGNSSARLEKLKEKNEKLKEERKTRVASESGNKKTSGSSQQLQGVHPARAALME